MDCNRRAIICHSDEIKNHEVAPRHVACMEEAKRGKGGGGIKSKICLVNRFPWKTEGGNAVNHGVVCCGDVITDIYCSMRKNI